MFNTVKKVAIPITETILPMGMGILATSLADTYVPHQDKKSQQILQNIAVGAVTMYVSNKVTEHVVTKMSDSFDELDATLAQLGALKDLGKELKRKRGLK